MVPTLNRMLLRNATAHPVNWRGRSGRFYALEPLRLEDFSFKGDELYLIALGRHVMWAGGAADLVEDYVSRARFRLAMDCADRRPPEVPEAGPSRRRRRSRRQK